ncbi:hypothetical protein LC609_29055 [Nostoc sp. XA013]|nr:hypothetical protein [Nostoc sp. XA013]
MTRQEIEEKIIAPTWQDTSFKQELLSNPLLVELTEEVEQSIQGGGKKKAVKLEREGILLQSSTDYQFWKMVDKWLRGNK